uniref:Uncharacterized protein n=1 Tax=Elaeophora elaphi TaxID=1147741 RepID=A0A0R3RTN4_9BILA
MVKFISGDFSKILSTILKNERRGWNERKNEEEMRKDHKEKEIKRCGKINGVEEKKSRQNKREESLKRNESDEN